MKRHTVHTIFIVLFLVILMAWAWTLTGCANLKTNTGGACKELTNVAIKLNKAVIIAEIAHEHDPNLITQRHIDELEMIRNIVADLSIKMCIIDGLIPDKIK